MPEFMVVYSHYCCHIEYFEAENRTEADWKAKKKIREIEDVPSAIDKFMSSRQRCSNWKIDNIKEQEPIEEDEEENKDDDT